MPPQPPARNNSGNYHYHAYDYANSAARGPWGLSDPVATRGNYQFYSMVQDLTGLLNYGQSINVPNITLSRIGPLNAQDRYTLALSFGNATNQPNQRTVAITGGIHAREWIATEMAYLLAEYLIANYNPNPPPGNPRVKALRNLVNNRNILIIPMLNPDGIDRTVFGQGNDDRLWRKNLRALPGTPRTWRRLVAPGGQPNPPYRNVTAPANALAQYDVPAYDPAQNIPPLPAAVFGTVPLANYVTGVDLNRNYPTVAYGYDSPQGYGDSAPGSDSFHGPGRASENETANVIQAIQQTTTAAGTAGRLWTTIDYHSYGMKILYGEETTRTGLTATHKEIGQTLHALIGNQNGPTYQLEDAAPLLPYLPVGTVDDYMAQAHQANSFTIELDPDDNDVQEFQLDEDEILNVFRQNIRGALAAISAPVNVQEAQNAVNSFIGWNVFNAGNQVP
jgi:hypothetical protein